MFPDTRAPSTVRKSKKMSKWKSVLELDNKRSVIAGSDVSLADAIRNGADLRIYTEFFHNEHVDVTSDITDLIQEVSEFRVTYLLNDRWTAGIMNLRQPITLPNGFGTRSSMSFFMYNQDGHQAIARPYLDGVEPTKQPNAIHLDTPSEKFRVLNDYDNDTNAPSSNFIYDFESYRYCVCDDWEEVLSHNKNGEVVSGSLDKLTKAFSKGCEVKVGIDGLCNDLVDKSENEIKHEVFIQIGPSYYYTTKQLFMGESHPLVRVKPGIPLVYSSKGWDFGWVMVRTDGIIVQRIYNPYTMVFNDKTSNHATRWFVR